MAGHTSIYPELGRLAGRGLIEVTHEGARGSRTYAVTAAGRAELRGWLLPRPDATSRVRNELVLRMFLLSALDAAHAHLVLERISAHTTQESAELRAVRENAPELAAGGRAGFGRLALEYGIRNTEAVQDWAQWALSQLDEQVRHGQPASVGNQPDGR